MTYIEVKFDDKDRMLWVISSVTGNDRVERKAMSIRDEALSEAEAYGRLWQAKVKVVEPTSQLLR